MPVVGDETCGRAITDYLAARGISWAAWCFDPDWGPRLVSDWEHTPTRSGAFFRSVLSGSEPPSPPAVAHDGR